MTLKPIIVSILATGVFATSAQASCWSNKAICRAICGADCCDGWGLTAPVDPARLGQFSVEELRAETKRMRKTSGNRSFFTAVENELKTRGGAGSRAVGGAKISN